MKKIRKIVKYFVKRSFMWSFSAPSSIMMLSITGSDRLLPLFDEKENVTVLDDENKIYFKYLIFSLFQKRSLNFKKVLFQYYLNIVKALNPKMIITFVDNQEFYWELDKYLSKDLVFLTVQNGTHYIRANGKVPKGYRNWFLDNPPYYSNFVCFSDFDYDYFVSKGATILKHHCIGNVLISDYLATFSKKKIIFDICVIAQSRNNDLHAKKMLNYLISYMQERNVTACVALKRPYLHNAFNDHINDFYTVSNDSNLIVIPRREHSSQFLADSSKVSIGLVGTTVLRQVFSRGNKLYPLNFGSEEVSQPFDLFSHSLNPSYHEFRDHLDYLLNLNQDIYLSKNSNLMKYIDTVDLSSAPKEKLKRLLKKMLSL
jgi:hypothetical protein